MRKRRLFIPAILTLAAAGLVIAWAERGGDPEEEAARLARALQLDAGAVVADVGAGAGQLTIAMGRLYGGKLRLIATEVNGEKLSALRGALDAAGLRNVTLLQSGSRDPNLPGACCDAVVMRRVFHHIEHRAEFLSGLYDAGRGDARVAIIDFAPSWWRFWMHRHGVGGEEVIAGMRRAGFEKEQEVSGWGWWDYCLVFRRMQR
ncbi:MAG: class I SAM-dependent methyltransferase [Bryobacteraceae bacterium]